MEYGEGKEMFFEVPGDPVAKQRPRFAKRGGYMKAYTPAQTLDFERSVGFYFRSKHMAYVPTEKPIRIEINAYLRIPKLSNRKFKLVRNDDYPVLKKPDVDNMAKSILDGMNGIVYRDDKQVFSLTVNKFYGYIPRCEIKITVFEDLEVI